MSKINSAKTVISQDNLSNKTADELRIHNKRLMIVSRLAKKKRNVFRVKQYTTINMVNVPTAKVIEKENFEYKNERRRRWLFEFVEREAIK